MCWLFVFAPSVLDENGLFGTEFHCVAFSGDYVVEEYSSIFRHQILRSDLRLDAPSGVCDEVQWHCPFA
jgi:hypothetical protein